MTRTTRQIEYVHRDSQPDMLIITNMWPEETKPAYGIFVKRQVEALRDAGVRSDVLYVRGYVSKRVYLKAAVLLTWFSISRQRRYRLVHVHGGEMALVARLFVMRPMVATYHGDDVLGYKGDAGPVSRQSRMRSFFIRQQARCFAATVTQSLEMHRRLPGGVQADNTVIHCGVDPERFVPTDQAEARRKLDWDPDQPVVLFAATKPHEPRKRLDLAQDVVRKAEDVLGNIRLVVAEGVPPELMPVMMSAADCLLLTSMAEGSPVVIKEALMCNLPVVATDVADVRRSLSGITPSAVCTHDPVELSEALIQVLRSRRRSNGRERRDEQDQKHTVKQLLALYSSVGFTPTAVDDHFTSR